MKADRHEVVPGNVDFSVADPQKRVPIIFFRGKRVIQYRLFCPDKTDRAESPRY